MRRPAAIVALILAATAASEALAQGEQLGARVRRWRAGIDGDMRSSDSGLAGTSIDYGSTLEFDDDVDINDVAAQFVFPGFGKLNLQWWQGTFEGEGTLAQDVTWGSTTFTAGTPVEAEMKWQVGGILFEYGQGGGMAPGNALSGFAFQGGFKYFKIASEIDSASGGEDATVKGFLPVFGIHLRQAFSHFFTIEAEMNGLFVDIFSSGGIEGTFLDVAIQAQINISGAYLGVGYRWFRLDVEDKKADVDSAELDVKIDGFFIEIGIKW